MMVADLQEITRNHFIVFFLHTEKNKMDILSIHSVPNINFR